MSAYSLTTYLHPSASGRCETEFFQEAFVDFYRPETLYILLTQDAATCPPRGATESNWAKLRSRLLGKTNVVPIPIPDGKTPEKIWRIFDALTGCLSEGDEVVFDLTHGFRSQPVLALMAVSYLRVAHGAHLAGLVYGAYEARNRQTNESPTFDLLPMIALLDWTTATDKFLKTGDARELASLLKDIIEPDRNILSSHPCMLKKGLNDIRPAYDMI